MATYLLMGAIFELKEKAFIELKYLKFLQYVVSQTVQLNLITPI